MSAVNLACFVSSASAQTLPALAPALIGWLSNIGATTNVPSLRPAFFSPPSIFSNYLASICTRGLSPNWLVYAERMHPLCHSRLTQLNRHSISPPVHSSPWQRISTLASRVCYHYKTVIKGLNFSRNARDCLFCCTSFCRSWRYAAIVFKQACRRSKGCVVAPSPGMNEQKCS